MKDRLVHIDSLRIFFACSIFLYHYSNVFNVHIPIFEKYGNLGVQFFFIVSGYFISKNYKEKLLSKKIELRDFIKHRIVTLYPMYFVTNIIGMFIAIVDNTILSGEVANRTVNLYTIICTFMMSTIGLAAKNVTILGGVDVVC